MASLEHISAQLAQREFAQANTALRKLVRQKDKAGVDWTAAAAMARQLADEDTALAALQNWRAQSPTDPERLIAEIASLGATAKHQDAAKLARALQKIPSAATDGYYMEGFYQARFGEREKSIALCRQALEINKDHAPAWEHIALMNGFGDVQADLAEMERIANSPANQDQALAIALALGRAYDHLGDVDKAYSWVEKAAQFRSGPQAFNNKQIETYFTALRDTFSLSYTNEHAVENGGEGAVFILSPPRSGSTLLEQILSTAKGVKATSEHSILRNAAIRLGGMEPQVMRGAATSFKPEDWRSMSQDYFTGLRKRFGSSNVYTDKSLTNYIYAGLIRLLFPKAKFIWLRRDLRDVAWSCYRSRLYGAQWTENLETTCGFLQTHEAICRHWSKLYNDQLLEMSYEKLVSEPEESAKLLFDHIGVERPENWREFHQVNDPVATNSMAQVREPLHTKGIGGWKRYEKFLGPIYERCFQ